MSRICWDTMLFVYLLEGNPEFGQRVRELLDRSYLRGDTLLTSCLAMGELMAGMAGDRAKADTVRSTIVEMGFSFLPFDSGSMATFGELRSVHRLKAPDSIHLACAASGGVDMFLTNDTQLLKRGLFVPGIQFIADFTLATL